MPKLRQDLVDRANIIIENACNTTDLRQLVAELRDNLRDAPEPAPQKTAPKKRAPKRKATLVVRKAKAKVKRGR
jgi:hypothetical protein